MLTNDSETQDPDGAYIARWVPELAKLPRKWLHMPWKAPLEVLEAAGVSIGDHPGCTYPARVTTEVLQVCLMPRVAIRSHGIFVCLQNIHSSDSCCNVSPQSG